jgi:hypothetical protein
MRRTDELIPCARARDKQPMSICFDRSTCDIRFSAVRNRNSTSYQWTARAHVVIIVVIVVSRCVRVCRSRLFDFNRFRSIQSVFLNTPSSLPIRYPPRSAHYPSDTTSGRLCNIVTWRRDRRKTLRVT